MKKTKFYHNICTTIDRIGTTNCEHDKSFENSKNITKNLCILRIINNMIVITIIYYIMIMKMKIILFRMIE